MNVQQLAVLPWDQVPPAHRHVSRDGTKMVFGMDGVTGATVLATHVGSDA